MIDAAALARELADARATRRIVTAPAARDAAFDLDAAYAVGSELTRMRRADGHAIVGLKVGFASKAVWRALKLETLVWAPMYDDTVQYADDGRASLAIERMRAPKIEPEIVFKLRGPVVAGTSDAAVVLEAVEWLALGFEVIDCPFADWAFQPVDFVASYGLHAALVVGAPLPVTAANREALADALPRFTVRLMQQDRVVAEGSGRNSLRSPALCLAELASAVAKRAGAEPLRAGDLVSSGTLTESQPIAAGETWRAEVDGIDLPPVSVTVR